MTEPLLPYGRQWVDQQDVESVLAALRSEFLTTGPTVPRFEAALCRTTGANHAVAVSSGTSALHAAYVAAGLTAGDEIVTTPLTFAATANAARYVGATIRFVDVEPDTGNLDPGQLEQAITPATRLIVPVDYAGHPADYDRIAPVAARHGLAVVADAAHSLGATYRGRRVGTLADVTATSFHPAKLITTAEGGAVLTGRGDVAARAAAFRNHGILRDDTLLERHEGDWWYEIHELGHNYRLSDVHAALGISQLARLDVFLARRRRIAAAYSEQLAGVSGLTLPTVREGVEPSWHLYVVRVDGGEGRRRAVFDRLRQAGLGVQVHYIPVHYHPYYQRLGHRRGEFPIAEEFYRRAISLPIFPAMKDEEVERVVETVRRTISQV